MTRRHVSILTPPCSKQEVLAAKTRREAGEEGREGEEEGREAMEVEEAVIAGDGSGDICDTKEKAASEATDGRVASETQPTVVASEENSSKSEESS